MMDHEKTTARKCKTMKMTDLKGRKQRQVLTKAASDAGLTLSRVQSVTSTPGCGDPASRVLDEAPLQTLQCIMIDFIRWTKMQAVRLIFGMMTNNLRLTFFSCLLFACLVKLTQNFSCDVTNTAD